MQSAPSAGESAFGTELLSPGKNLIVIRKEKVIRLPFFMTIPRYLCGSNSAFGYPAESKYCPLYYVIKIAYKKQEKFLLCETPTSRVSCCGCGENRCKSGEKSFNCIHKI
jgi:hypothetical protein